MKEAEAIEKLRVHLGGRNVSFGCSMVQRLFIIPYNEAARLIEYGLENNLIERNESEPWVCSFVQPRIECDHDWEILEAKGVKQCTYPECQEERELTQSDYENLELGRQQFEIDQDRGS